jgi:glycosyltransferase involved in cell wall biosynthesis
MSATDVLFVSGEPLWPPIHGGRIRGARLAEALAGELRVCVLAASSDSPPSDLEYEALPDEPPPHTLAAFGSTKPAIGRMLLGPRRGEAVAAAARRRRPSVVIFAHGYLAAVAPPLAAKVVVDFADVDVRRMASLARRGPPRKRLVWSWEWAKARRWEPAVARRAALTVAVTPGDAEVLSSWGGRVVSVPHGADRVHTGPSPPAGPVTFVGNLGYGPNLDGARFLLDEVWPRIRAREPAIRLRIVGWWAERYLGWQSVRDGVEVVSNAPDVGRYFAEAALVVAPVREGGGAQMKVAEALGSGRIVVATPFSLRSAHPDANGAVIAADGAERFAEVVVRLWRDLDERRAHERVLARPVVPTWDESARPLVSELKRMVRPG